MGRLKKKKYKKPYLRKGRIVKAHEQGYYVNPMRPKDASLPRPNGWVYEPKYDGTRIWLITTRNDTKLINRRRVDKSHLYPELDHLHKVLGSGMIIDGEVFSPSKKEPYGDFLALSKRDRLKSLKPNVTKMYPLRFVAFDIIRYKGKDVRQLPFEARRNLLLKVIPKKNMFIKVISGYSKPPIKMLRRAHAEGLVAKNIHSKYFPGKTRGDWIKKKFTKESDLKVMGFTPGTGKRKGLFGAIRAGAWKRGKIVEVANVGTGFSDAQLQEIKRDPPPYIRVKYRRVGSGGRLIEPRYIGPRYDLRDEDTHI